MLPLSLIKAFTSRYWLTGEIVLLCFVTNSTTLAQIVPDATLPVNSTVTPSGNTNIIEGGTTAGGNLFHSFREFSIPTGAAAFFNNAVEIQNIFTRVTGGNISNIDGLIRANGTANLFLLNPNGIIFGPNARLNIGGSFFGSTASSIRFADGTVFSASAAQTTPLLTINVPIGLQYGTSFAAVQVQGSNLQVQPGRSLALVGGNVSLNGGTLLAPGGRVELGGAASEGTVALGIKGNIGNLSFADGIGRANVSVTNSSRVDVTAGGGGSIAINASKLEILETSGLLAGIASGLGSIDSRAGDIVIDATGAVAIANDSFIINSVQSGGIGDAGDIEISTESLAIAGGAGLQASTLGQGDAGNVKIAAGDIVSFDGVDSNGFSSAAFSAVEEKAVGKGGDIEISTNSLFVTGGAQLQASTRGKGDAGTVKIFAGNKVSFDGVGSNGLPSGAFSTVEKGAVGNGGGIEISTNSLFVTGGAQLQALTRGQGEAGTLKITAGHTVSFDGIGSNGKSSGAFSTVEEKAVGKGGGIEISTNLLRVTNGARLDASTFGKGDAGSVKISATDKVSFDGVGSNGLLSAATSKVGEKASGTGGSIEITTKSLSVTGAARLDVSTLGQGDAGSIKISATDTVSFDLGDAFSLVGDEACGTGGSIEITTKSLSVTGGAQLQASTFGQGDAGSVKISASDTVSFDGDINEFPSGAGSSVEEGAEGNGGGIEISTKSLFVTGGAQLQALTRGQGDAGTIKITASDTVFFDGVDSDGFSSSARSTVEEGASGNGGNIEIATDSLRITNGAGLTATSRGNGKAGDIVINADSIRLDNQAVLESNTTGGQGNITLRAQSLQLTRDSSITTDATGGESGGNIDVQVSSLILRQNSRIEASAGGSKVQGGNITLDTDVIAALENSDISANSNKFLGGQVIINAQSVFGTQFRTAPTSESDITATGGTPEQSGTVQINTPDVDPSSGLIELPANVVDVTGLVVDPCAAVRGGSSFSVTGRGGIPPSPDEALVGDAYLVDLVTIDPQVQGSRGLQEQRTMGEIRSDNVNSDTPLTDIVEATGWYTNEKGEVVLIASTPTRYRLWQNPYLCK